MEWWSTVLRAIQRARPRSTLPSLPFRDWYTLGHTDTRMCAHTCTNTHTDCCHLFSEPQTSSQCSPLHLQNSVGASFPLPPPLYPGVGHTPRPSLQPIFNHPGQWVGDTCEPRFQLSSPVKELLRNVQEADQQSRGWLEARCVPDAGRAMMAPAGTCLWSSDASITPAEEEQEHSFCQPAQRS